MAVKQVEFYKHNLEQEDIEQLMAVLNSTFLTTGPVTADFEQRFGEYTGMPHVIATNSCTSAMHLALEALGIGPGDEVITTPMTFVATALAIRHTGAHPVFVDVEPETGLMDVSKIEAAITPRTKAILPVHLYGCMVDMRGVFAVAAEHGLRIVEDAAHCVEGARDGVRPGQLSDAVCYSFYATKNLACGEGGAVAVHDPALAQRIRCARLHGMSSDAAARYKTPYRHWDVQTPGWKANMDSIHAALLVKQIDRLDDNLVKRQALADRYREKLAVIPGISLPRERGKNACHLQTVWVSAEQRDWMLHYLQEQGVACTVNYRAVHTLDYFQKTYHHKPEDFPIAHDIGLRTITLPLYPKLTEEEQDYVIDVLTTAQRALSLEESPQGQLQSV